MTDAPDLELAGRSLTRARTDVEAWLAALEQGQLATVAPFGQMFIYQLKMRGRLADKAFAIDELYRLYYRRADGKGEPPMPADVLRGIV
jgi:Tfp pilus assembly protein PilN